MVKYNELILKHFYQPANVGTLPSNDKYVGTGVVGSASQAAMLQLQFKINSFDLIEVVKFKALGCVSAIAVLSWLSERLIGMNLTQAAVIKSDAIQKALNLPETERYCAYLAEDVLKAALADFADKQNRQEATI